MNRDAQNSVLWFSIIIIVTAWLYSFLLTFQQISESLRIIASPPTQMSATHPHPQNQGE